jgi:hypothetical protein
MTAICGKSNGDRICFDIWINRPKYVNRIRVNRSRDIGPHRRVVLQAAEEGGRGSKIQLLSRPESFVKWAIAQ